MIFNLSYWISLSRHGGGSHVSLMDRSGDCVEICMYRLVVCGVCSMFGAGAVCASDACNIECDGIHVLSI